MTPTQPLPCPCCDEEPQVVQAVRFSIYCDNCDALTVDFKDAATAVRAWNAMVKAAEEEG